MADITDVSATIASALTEAGVTGTLGVTMDGERAVAFVGEDASEAVEVIVTVKPLAPAASGHA